MKITRELIELAFRDNRPATTARLAMEYLQSNPDDFFITLNYGEVLYLMARYEEALQVYDCALARFKEDRHWAIFNQLGQMYRYWGRLAEAEAWFRKAMELNPEEVFSYVFYGACQARQGKLIEAEATHRAAIRLGESHMLDEAYHNLGLVLRGQGRLAEAAECFRKATEISPKYSDAIEALDDVERAMVISVNDACEQ